VADPAAGVVGRLWGSRPLGKGSVQGSAAFLVAAWGALALLTADPLAVLPVAVAVAAVEILPLPVDDNLTIPLATGALLWLILGTPASPSSFPF
ncbi:MAG: hypothetical protein RQ751_07935, partial [Longimicrobiales bacterium]|nr:hypothetical protein [Longimicrobiales bacterium]